MDTKNLDNLIQDYAQLANKAAALEAENAALRQFVSDLAEWDYSGKPFAGNEKEAAFRRFQNEARTIKAKWNNQAPQAIAPQPTIALPQHRFDTGDKVRRANKDYEIGRYDTVVMFTINGYCLDKIYGTEDYAYFPESALEPYIETPKPLEEGNTVEILTGLHKGRKGYIQKISVLGHMVCIAGTNGEVSRHYTADELKFLYD